jgi:nucleotide-binding universal stress UspA family protein
MMKKEPPPPVVVGVDGTAEGRLALAFAVTEAEKREASLLVIHAHHLPAMNPALSYLTDDQLRHPGRIALDSAESNVRATHPDVHIETLLVPGRPARILVDQSRLAQLVVVGSHEHGHLVGGSTANAVSARAHCPVVRVNPTWTERDDGRAVVGVDGSAGGRDALAFAFAYAATHRLRLAVVRSWDLPMSTHVGNAPSKEETDDWRARAQLALAEDLAGWRADYPDLDVLPHVERSFSAAETLIRHSKGSRLLVIGARGAGGVPGLHLGWTAHSVLAHAESPVAVVPRVSSHQRAARSASPVHAG